MLKKLLLSIAACLMFCVGSAVADEGGSSTLTLAQKIADKMQLSNLPTIYLTVPDAVGQDINSVLTKTGNVAEYHAAIIQVVDGTGQLDEFTDSKLDIKVRGNSTATDSKRPYRLKFGKDKKDAAGNVIETHKHDMLGLGYAKRNWTLLTNHKDKSLIHNALTYHVGKAVGMDFCPGYQFVDLVINGEYRGNYQLSDHCEVGSHRIDVDEETGWFIEAARGDMVEEPLVEAAGLRMSIKNPEPADDAETSALKAAVRDYFIKLNHFWGIYSTACSDEEFQNIKTGWRAYIDEESLAKFYIGINLTDDYDGFMTVKMYREADGKLKFGPLWDKDLAYGNWQNHGKLCEEYQPGYTFCDHMARMMTDPYFVRTVHDKLHEILDAGFVEKMQAKIYEIGNSLTESQKLNQSKWYTCDNYPAAQKELADYVAEHTAFFVNAIDKKYTNMGCANLPEQPGSGSDTTDPDNPGSGNASDGHVCPYTTKLGEWQNIPLPSSAIHPRATAAHLVVMGASFFRLLNSNDENDYIDAYSFEYNGANMRGREFDITDKETLDKAKAGTLLLRCGGGSATVTITCTVPETTDPDPTDPTDPEGDTSYHFVVYDESGTPTEINTTDKDWAMNQDLSTKPNTLFITDAANVTGTNVVSAGVCQELVITDGHPFYNKGDKFKAASATYTRTVDAATQWGTICLPFKVVSDDEVTLYQLKEMDDASGVMTFELATSTGGGTPLLFRKVNSAATSVTFHGAQQDDGYITVKATVAMDKNIAKNVPAGWKFCGNVENRQVVNANEDLSIYYIAKDQFWHATAEVTINPFRAYFSGIGTSASNAPIRIHVEDAAGIETIVNDFDHSAQPAYDLNGRMIHSDQLRPGFYVIGGEKVIVR